MVPSCVVSNRSSHVKSLLTDLDRKPTLDCHLLLSIVVRLRSPHHLKRWHHVNLTHTSGLS